VPDYPVDREKLRRAILGSCRREKNAKAKRPKEAALAQLQAAYRGTGLTVRFYPDCCTIMRWQVGRNGDGEHFAVIAYGSTPKRLLECLKARERSQGRNDH